MKSAFVPERSKGLASSASVFVLVGSNPTECNFVISCKHIIFKFLFYVSPYVPTSTVKVQLSTVVSAQEHPISYSKQFLPFMTLMALTSNLYWLTFLFVPIHIYVLLWWRAVHGSAGLWVMVTKDRCIDNTALYFLSRPCHKIDLVWQRLLGTPAFTQTTTVWVHHKLCQQEFGRSTCWVGTHMGISTGISINGLNQCRCCDLNPHMNSCVSN